MITSALGESSERKYSTEYQLNRKFHKLFSAYSTYSAECQDNNFGKTNSCQEYSPKLPKRNLRSRTQSALKFKFGAVQLLSKFQKRRIKEPFYQKEFLTAFKEVVFFVPNLPEKWFFLNRPLFSEYLAANCNYIWGFGRWKCSMVILGEKYLRFLIYRAPRSSPWKKGPGKGQHASSLGTHTCQRPFSLMGFTNEERHRLIYSFKGHKITTS